MLKNIALIAIVATALAGCSQKQHEYGTPKFGIWKMNDQTCMLEAERNGIILRTDGTLSAEYLYMKITSHFPLARSPIVVANNLKTVPLKVEGTDRFFSFELPYTPYTVSRLMDKNSFLIVNYRVQNTPKQKKAVFNTAGLSSGVSYLAKNCLNY
jgi:hypothetical protein